MEVVELSQVNKHIMLKNGLMEFELDSVKQSSCCCGHSITDHLWPTLDCCLVKELCICDRFLDRNFKTPVAERYGKLPKREEEEQKQKQKDQIEDNQLVSYIQTLAKM